MPKLLGQLPADFWQLSEDRRHVSTEKRQLPEDLGHQAKVLRQLLLLCRQMAKLLGQMAAEGQQRHRLVRWALAQVGHPLPLVGRVAEGGDGVVKFA
jgi:hypothetical protein